MIWLSDRPDGWLRRVASVGAEPSTHRVTVDVPSVDVMSWQEFKKPPFPWAAPKVLEHSARRYNLGDPCSWYVIARPIPKSEWVEIVRIADSQALWPASP